MREAWPRQRADRYLRGPAQSSDIERVRRDVDEVAVRAVHEEEVSVVRRRLRVSDRTAEHEEDARA